MKYLFEVTKGYSTQLLEYDIDSLSTKQISQDDVIQKLRSNNEYYINANIHRGILEISDGYTLMNFETEINGNYYKHVEGVLYKLDTDKTLSRYQLNYAGHKKNWYVIIRKDDVTEFHVPSLRCVYCIKVDILGTDVKTLSQARRLIVLRG